MRASSVAGSIGDVAAAKASPSTGVDAAQASQTLVWRASQMSGNAGSRAQRSAPPQTFSGASMSVCVSRKSKRFTAAMSQSSTADTFNVRFRERISTVRAVRRAAPRLQRPVSAS